MHNFRLKTRKDDNNSAQLIENQCKYNKDNLKYVQIIRGNHTKFLPVLVNSCILFIIIASLLVLKLKYEQENKEIYALAEIVEDFGIVYEKEQLNSKELRKIKSFTFNELDKPSSYITSLLAEDNEKDVLYILSKRKNYLPYVKPTTLTEKIENILDTYKMAESINKNNTPVYERDYIVSKYRMSDITASLIDNTDLRTTYFSSYVPFKNKEKWKNDTVNSKDFTKLVNNNNHIMFVNSIANLRSLSKNMNSVGYYYGVMYYKYSHVPNAVFVDTTINVKENQRKIELTKQLIVNSKQSFYEYIIATGKLALLLTILLHILLVNSIVLVISQLDNRLTKELFLVASKEVIRKKQFTNLLHYDYFNHSRYIFFSLLWIPLFFGVLIIYIYQPLTMSIQYRSNLGDLLITALVVVSVVVTMHREKTIIYSKSSLARNTVRQTLNNLNENSNKGLDEHSMLKIDDNCKRKRTNTE